MAQVINQNGEKNEKRTDIESSIDASEQICASNVQPSMAQAAIDSTDNADEVSDAPRADETTDASNADEKTDARKVEKCPSLTQGRYTVAFRHLLCTLLPIYIFIVLWGVLFKCNMDYILEKGYDILYGESLARRMFGHDDLLNFFIMLSIGKFAHESLIVVALNCVLLTPFGLFLMHLLKKKSVWRITLISFLLCLAIEIVQLFTYWGAFSLADLVTNTLSGYLGARLYGAIYRPERERIFTIICGVLLVLSLPLVVIICIRTGRSMDFYFDLATRPMW